MNCLETSMLIYTVYHLITFYMNSKDIESIKRNGDNGKKIVDLNGMEGERGGGGGKDGKGEIQSWLN